jgi:XTP/dITP diphosphohydrolase
VARLTGAELLVATGNAGKMAEFAALLAPFGSKTHSLTDLGLPEPDETEFSFAGNALLKARVGAIDSGLITLADDSGLIVDDLGGAPGIYTADWAETGNGRDFSIAMTKTWNMLLAVKAGQPYRAEFRCALAVVWPKGAEEVYEGRLRGQIVWPMRGTFGHGYDPIFQPDGHAVTLGELPTTLKNGLSHRADAFRKLVLGCFT